MRILFAILLCVLLAGSAIGEEKQTPAYAGSQSCRQCHEKFYELWATSHHGLAMQPYTRAFASSQLTAQNSDMVIGKSRYRADLVSGMVIETGLKGKKNYPIKHVLGGKNVYYFLTPLEKGRLQTLPVAYDLNTKKWFDTAASGVRHFPGTDPDQPVSWKDTAYTFNTSCYSCHVSQLSTNYDIKTDTYTTTWAEPGINCETCHGPSAEHNRVMQETPKGQKPGDINIISWKNFAPAQKNAACSICHAKMSPITATFMPGDRFFDHFDIATLEDPDFYPDGRDLGENYTYTSWLMSPCARSGKLHCITCHTSSGRYRFKADEKANDACMPCHEDKVKSGPAHTFHKEGSTGNRCIACHMPMTSFARMNRTDHSMRPPSPAATIAFKSPNACNICHKDKDAAWSETYVRKWRTRDYQAPVLNRAGLIDAARKRNWNKLPEMINYITDNNRDEVFATSLIRLIANSGDPRIAPMLLKAIKDPSPLLRAAASEALQNVPTKEAAWALVKAAGDDYRLVRVRAAASLSGLKDLPMNDVERKAVETADAEYRTSLTSRPDQWDSYYNLGNYYANRADLKQAVTSYDIALRLEPRSVLALVNKSIAYARLGENQKAENALQKALKISPDNAAANFNMGLLKGEQNDMQGAEKYLSAALKADPRMAQAAYNLCIILSKGRLEEAIGFCRKACELRPDNPRYTYTLAFYLSQHGDTFEAIRLLKTITRQNPEYIDAAQLLKHLSGEEQKD